MLASLLRPNSVARRRASVVLPVALVLGACVGGCVRRRMTIVSNPPGARVYVDDYEIGTTPVSHNFVYYGQRKIRLVKDGYETLTALQPVPPPWYQIPPWDFVSENLIPGEIRDRRTLHYQLTPQRVVPTEELLRRGEDLRRGVTSVRGGALPPAAAPVPAGAEPIPAPGGIGGQPVYPLPPSGPASGTR